MPAHWMAENGKCLFTKVSQNIDSTKVAIKNMVLSLLYCLLMYHTMAIASHMDQYSNIHWLSGARATQRMSILSKESWFFISSFGSCESFFRLFLIHQRISFTAMATGSMLNCRRSYHFRILSPRSDHCMIQAQTISDRWMRDDPFRPMSKKNSGNESLQIALNSIISG